MQTRAWVLSRELGGFEETYVRRHLHPRWDTTLDGRGDVGADIEADGAVIAGGTPLTDATAFGHWHAARRLIERGAKSRLGEVASLGLLDRVQAHLAHDNPTPQDLTSTARTRPTPHSQEQA